MAIKNLKNIDNKLKEKYQEEVTAPTPIAAQPFVDRSEVLFAQMNFIAMANKQRFNLP